MNTLKFVDYYRILEVHYDARPEIIQAAYKRLSRIYHPDNRNVSDSSAMNLINEAYSILNDTKKRAAYHTEWLKHFTCRNQFTNSVAFTPPGQGDSSLHAAQTIMETFFQAQKQNKNEEAYLLLTKEDQDRTSLEDFSTWRDLVSHCYEMQDFKVRYYSSYRKCRIDDVIYPLVAEFAVTVTDMDTLSTTVSTETLQKYAAFDGVSWKICLGLQSITKLILQFQLLTEKRNNFDPLMLYRSAVSFKDPLTGLLSETGFLEQANRELQRSRRYHNPFCIAAFKLYPSKKDIAEDTMKNSENYEWKDVCSFATVISRYLRSTDLSARLNNGMICCLFIETIEPNAHKAAKKLLHFFQEKQKKQGLLPEQYCTLSYGIIPFHGHENIEELIFAACSKANIVNNTIHFTTAYN